MKTVRFAELVAKMGRPEVHPLWTAPAQDREFQRALKAHRVLTLHQENVGTKKDFGTIGFHEEPLAQYLVFPKSIGAFAGRRVIGINYDLLAQPAIALPKKSAANQVQPGGARRVSRRLRAPATEGGVLRPERPEEEASSEEPDLVGTNLGARSQAGTATRGKTRAATSRGERPNDTGESVSPAQQEPPASAGPAESTSSLHPSVAREIARALKELKAGKAVAAYERLQHLLREAGQERP